MIREHKGSSKIELVNSYIVLDIETTGLDLVYDEIIEIGALKVVNGQIVETFSELVRPNNKISQFISSLTGITNEMLDSAQEIDKVLPRFIDFAQNMLIVGHNVNFDINFIYDYTLNVLNKPFANNFIDTLRLSRKIFNNLKNHKLQTISKSLNFDEKIHHRAICDCKITYKIYEYIKQHIIDKKLNLLELFTPKTKKLNAENIKTQNKVFDETHIFYNKNCAFTGSLQILRKEAMQKVVDLGRCCQDMTKDTNFLILGNKDYHSENKSAKYRKAEQYILDGLDIQIISENVFIDLVSPPLESYQKKPIGKQSISQANFDNNVDALILDLNICFEPNKDFELNEDLAYKYSNEATILEKDNNIQESIDLYEKAIYYVFPGNYAYDRLLILYKKNSQEQKNKKILEYAIFVFYKLISPNRVDRLTKLKKYYDKYIKLR